MNGPPQDGEPGHGQAAWAPDWYPDPLEKAAFRYWDGSQWTDHTAYDHVQGDADAAPGDTGGGHSAAAQRILQWTDAAKDAGA